MIKLIAVEKDLVTVELKVDISGSMLDAEERIQSAVNAAGTLLTQETLKRFDTDGAPIVTGPVKWTSKGQVEKVFQTPYGETAVARHVYQASGGGKTYCPLDRDARIVTSSRSDWPTAPHRTGRSWRTTPACRSSISGM